MENEAARQKYRVVAVLNAQAGTLLHHGGDALAKRIEGALDADHDLAGFQLVQPKEMQAALRDAFASDADIVLVGGGDGTLQHAAGLAMEADKTLGILPLGTLNILARDLRIPLDPLAAVSTLAEGRVRSIDVADVGGELCLLKAMAGRLSATIRLRESRRRSLRALAWLKMGWYVLRSQLRRPGRRYRLTVDEQEIDVRAAVLLVSLTRFRGRLEHPFARDRLDGGRLVVYGLSAKANRRHGRERFVTARDEGLLDRFILAEGEAVTVETKRSHIHLSVDGELRLFPSPVEIRILPKALRVMMPADAPAG